MRKLFELIPGSGKFYLTLLGGFLIISCSSPEQNSPTEMNLVARTLDSIYVSDQGNRVKVDSIRIAMESFKKMITQSMRVMRSQDSAILKKDEWATDSLWKCINKQDTINLIRVQKILDHYGWLGADVVGEQGNSTLFLVIQHADLKTQEKYLPMMKEAAKNKKAEMSQLALLIDRVEIENNRPQVYGSQIGGTSGHFTIFPITDEINVNKRRAEVGLEPLEEYVKYWNIEYHLPAGASPQK